MFYLGEVVKVESTAGGGSSSTQQDPVREDREHQKHAAFTRPGNDTNLMSQLVPT